jgi:tRNA A-37 threonylcarbamoyl transferase component Bud32
MHALAWTGHVVADRYRLQDQIGRGAMGTVWRARDELLDRDVAAKEVTVSLAVSPVERDAVYQRTLREAKTAARLNHPGVVTVFDVVEEDGRPWIIMELVQARSLEQVLAQDGPLPVTRAADVGAQMVSALATAHAAGVLHRDVKPSNVLLCPDGRAVLTDFGIATLEGDAQLTQTGMVMGTPAFTPPERIRGEPASPASDLWALGATLYAAVQGRGPYQERGGAITTMNAVINEETPVASSAGQLGPVIAALMQKDPAARPDTASTARMLNGVLSGRSGGGPGNPGAAGGPGGPGGPGGSGGAGAAAGVMGAAAAGAMGAAAAGAMGAAAAGAGEMPWPAGAPWPRSGSGPAGTPWAASRSGPGAGRGGSPYPPGGAGYPAGGGGYPAGGGGYPPGRAGPTAGTVYGPQGGAMYGAPVAEAPTYFPPSGGPGGAPASTNGLPPRGLPPNGGTQSLPTAGQGGAHAAGPARSGRATLVACVAVAIVAVGLLGGFAVSHFMRREADGKAGLKPGTGHAASTGTHSSAPASPPSSPQSTASAAPPPLPDGYTWYSLPAASAGTTAGFRLAVPSGWSTSRSGLVTYARNPSGAEFMEVDLTPHTYAGVMAEARWLQAKTLSQNKFPGYRRISISPTSVAGSPAALWAFSWQEAGVGRVIVEDYLFDLPAGSGSQSYAVYASAPVAGWSPTVQALNEAIQTFQPLS